MDLNTDEKELVACSIIDTINDLRDYMDKRILSGEELLNVNNDIDILLSIITKLGSLNELGISVETYGSSNLH